MFKKKKGRIVTINNFHENYQKTFNQNIKFKRRIHNRQQIKTIEIKIENNKPILCKSKGETTQDKSDRTRIV